jgi:GNAT superfamily N-acetyltransferase
MTTTTRTGRKDRELLDQLALDLPDLPRWVMARGLCLSGRGEVLLGPEGAQYAGYFILDSERPWLCRAIRRPVAALVQELLEVAPSVNEILVHGGNTEHLGSLLPGWVARPATLHLLPAAEELPPPAHEVRWLTEADLDRLDHLDEPLRREVELQVRTVPTVATIVDGRPVAFCGALYETESWWDVSLDTPDAYRRQGYGSSAAAFLVGEMLARGKRPVWGTLDANEGSLAMSRKYGFRPVDRMIVFTPAERRSRERP